MPSLYRRLLGKAYDSLPPALRDFHDIDRERHFQAVFRITRGRGWLRNFVCWLGGLPPAGESVPMRLRVIPEGESERWVRDFGGIKLVSVQRARDGLMVESIGALRLGFRLHVESPVLRLELRKVWLLGIRCPLWLAPGGNGVEVGQEGGCAILVRATAPLLGQIVQYEGFVTPAEL